MVKLAQFPAIVDTASNRVTVGVCTYGRPHLRETLLSLAAQALPVGWDMHVLVADNANPPSSGGMVDEAKRETRLSIEHLVAPPFNISTARNTILESVETAWLAFIDDDEVAPPYWLSELIEQAEQTKGDAIFGPVQAVYEDTAPQWVKSCDFHSTDVTFVSGQIITGYSCNVLMHLASPLYRDLRFAPELGTTGGEDTLFFSTLFARGGRLSYAPNAVIFEPVPQDRTTFEWLFKRRFRSGQTHARLINKGTLVSKIKQLVLAAIKAFFCFAASLVLVLIPNQSRRWILRGALHVGVISALLGKGELKLYGSPN